jgi:hypothetical protein
VIAAKVRCLDVPSGSGFTLNSVYDVISVSWSDGAIGAVVLNDSDTPVGVSVNGAGFEFTELYVAKRVI